MTRYVFIILFFITLFSCNKKRISNYNIDTTIDYPVFHDSILNDTNFGIESGLSEIVVKEYSIETIYSIDTCKTFCFNAYANKDTTVILFDWLNCYMKILLYDGEYEIVTKYSTDIIETYPDGEHKGTCLIADLEHQKLVFKSKSFKAGDIIYGFMDIETNPIKSLITSKNNEYYTRKDHFYGPFVVKIQSKESFMSQPLSHWK